MNFEFDPKDIPADLDRAWRLRVSQEAPNQARGLQGLIGLLDREMAKIENKKSPRDMRALTLVGNEGRTDLPQARIDAQKIVTEDKRQAKIDGYILKQLIKGKHLLEKMAQSEKPWSEAAQMLGWDDGVALEVMQDLGEALDASAQAEVREVEQGLNIANQETGPGHEERIQRYLEVRDTRNVLMRIQEIVKEAD